MHPAFADARFEEFTHYMGPLASCVQQDGGWTFVFPRSAPTLAPYGRSPVALVNQSRTLYFHRASLQSHIPASTEGACGKVDESLATLQSTTIPYCKFCIAISTSGCCDPQVLEKEPGLWCSEPAGACWVYAVWGVVVSCRSPPCWWG